MGPVGAGNGAPGPARATGATGPAGRVGGMSGITATDSVGGALHGVIEVDDNGVVTSADVFNLHTVNANGPTSGDVRYTLINAPGLPNNGSSFGLTSSWANGQANYYFDNLWFVFDGSLTGPTHTVRMVVSNGGYLGDPAGSLRMDAYGDPIGLSGTLTRIIHSRPGATGATGPAGAVGAAGATGSTGSVGPMGPAGANGAQGVVGPIGAQGPAGPAGAMGPAGAAGPAGQVGGMWEFTATDSVGGALHGVIEVDDNGVVTSADVFNLHTVNANGPTSGDVRYTLINAPGLPNNGSSFGLTSSWANGQANYYFDNLWFVFDGSLTGPTHTVRMVVSNGGYLGDPAGSLRMDAYGDPIGLSGTLTRIIHSRPGATGATGPAGAVGATGATGPAGSNGSNGSAGPMGPAGAQGPAGPAGAMGPAGANGAQGAAGATGATGPAGADGARVRSVQRARRVPPGRMARRVRWSRGRDGSAGTSDLPSGTVIFLVEGTPAPAGWTLLGSGLEVVKPKDGGEPGAKVRLDVYRKN